MKIEKTEISPRVGDELGCLRCGHIWVSRVARPVTCPACKSPLWNKPYQRPRNDRSALLKEALETIKGKKQYV